MKFTTVGRFATEVTEHPEKHFSVTSVCSVAKNSLSLRPINQNGPLNSISRRSARSSGSHSSLAPLTSLRTAAAMVRPLG